MSKAVISTIGHDRPGLVSAITALATELHLNIEDSRMMVLGGEFAVLMALEGEPETLATFETQLAELCSDNNSAYIFRPTDERQDPKPSRPYKATVVAMDHPGIVHAIAAFFSARNINIRDLQTETTPAAHTGTPIFNVTLVIEVPADTKIRDLKEAFDEFCADDDLDGQLQADR